MLDWVCERDFYLGVPQSGHTYGNLSKFGPQAYKIPIGWPYIYGFGNMEKGASIKEGAYELSFLQIIESFKLWNKIEQLNNKNFNVEHIPRFPGPGAGSSYKEFKEMKWLEYIKMIARIYYGGQIIDKLEAI